LLCARNIMTLECNACKSEIIPGEVFICRTTVKGNVHFYTMDQVRFFHQRCMIISLEGIRTVEKI
jgi:hypothetical protein